MNASENAASSDTLCLTAEETDRLHFVACRLVESAANKERASVADYPLGRLAEYPVVGVFVTLRKGGELRGCIGNFANAAPLGQSLERAARGSVCNDPRFPPVAPDELPDLTVSVSLLHSRELVEGTSEQRAAQIVIGQHGLDIQFRGNKGLLLPSVATDFGLDALGFLQAVCRKAGLPDNAWREPNAILYRFSAVSLSGPWKPAP